MCRREGGNCDGKSVDETVFDRAHKCMNDNCGLYAMGEAAYKKKRVGAAAERNTDLWEYFMIWVAWWSRTAECGT